MLERLEYNILNFIKKVSLKWFSISSNEYNKAQYQGDMKMHNTCVMFDTEYMKPTNAYAKASSVHIKKTIFYNLTIGASISNDTRQNNTPCLISLLEYRISHQHYRFTLTGSY